MPDVTFREASTATISEARRSSAHALGSSTVAETGPSTRQDTDAHGEGGYFNGYMEGW